MYNHELLSGILGILLRDMKKEVIKKQAERALLLLKVMTLRKENQLLTIKELSEHFGKKQYEIKPYQSNNYEFSLSERKEITEKTNIDFVNTNCDSSALRLLFVDMREDEIEAMLQNAQIFGIVLKQRYKENLLTAIDIASYCDVPEKTVLRWQSPNYRFSKKEMQKLINKFSISD